MKKIALLLIILGFAGCTIIEPTRQPTYDYGYVSYYGNDPLVDNYQLMSSNYPGNMDNPGAEPRSGDFY